MNRVIVVLLAGMVVHDCADSHQSTILHWEDRATEWSGIPDKVEIRIDVIESARGDTIDSAIVKRKSGLATFGGDHPQDLLPKPVEDYVASLYLLK
jgi:hypothetical protein